MEATVIIKATTESFLLDGCCFELLVYTEFHVETLPLDKFYDLEMN